MGEKKRSAPGIFPDKKTVNHFFGLPGQTDKRESDSSDEEYTISYKGLFEVTVTARSDSDAIRKAANEEDWKRVGRISQRDLEII